MKFLLLLAVAGGAVLAPSPVEAEPSPSPPPEVEATCAQFLGSAQEDQLGMMRQILSYDSLGYFQPHMQNDIPGVTDYRGFPDYVLFSAKKAAARAKELCLGREAETVYHVLGGTKPLYPYGRVPQGRPTLRPSSKPREAKGR